MIQHTLNIIENSVHRGLASDEYTDYIVAIVDKTRILDDVYSHTTCGMIGDLSTLPPLGFEVDDDEIPRFVDYVIHRVPPDSQYWVTVQTMLAQLFSIVDDSVFRVELPLIVFIYDEEDGDIIVEANCFEMGTPEIH